MGKPSSACLFALAAEPPGYRICIAKMPGKRATATILLAASAVMLLCGALLLPWWAGQLPRGSFEIDLRGMSMCIDSLCGATKPLSVADASAVAWAKLGTSTFAASLVAALLIVLCIGKTIRGARQSTLHWLAGAMTMFTGALALLFVWLRPEFGDWTPSYGMACMLAGSLGGAIAVTVAAQTADSETG